MVSYSDVLDQFRQMSPDEFAVFSARLGLSVVPFVGGVLVTALEQVEAAAQKKANRIWAAGGFDPVKVVGAGMNVSAITDVGVGVAEVRFAKPIDGPNYLVLAQAEGDRRVIVDQQERSGFRARVKDNESDALCDGAFKFVVMQSG